MGAEEWRIIPGFDAWYEASDLGRIRSWRTRACWYRRAAAPTLLRCTTTGGKGYVRAKLTHPVFGKLTIGVHQVVLAAFVGPRPHGKVCDHINALRHDNRPANLRWITPAENIRHAADLGHIDGRPGGRAQSTLSEEDAEEVRRLRAAGLKLAEIAERFGVSDSTVSRIALGHSWKKEVA